MTRKDYELIAAAIRRSSTYFQSSMFFPVSEKEQTERRAMLRHVTESIADRLADENPRFDRARFIDACLGG